VAPVFAGEAQVVVEAHRGAGLASPAPAAATTLVATFVTQGKINNYKDGFVSQEKAA
jgi:hypothetical protein